MHVLLGLAMHDYDNKVHTAKKDDDKVSTSCLGAWFLFVVGWAHVLGAGYLSYSHQAGTQPAMSYVSSSLATFSSATVHQLAPCFSFPGRAFLPPHVDITLCTPDCTLR